MNNTNPLLNLVRSRKVIIAVATLFISLAVMRLPELASIQEPLLQLIVTLALALIGGITIEDAAKHAKSVAAPETAKKDLEDVVRAIINELANPNGSESGGGSS
jgi:hypothetical protein